MTQTKKDFKDWDISDFKDMGSLAHHPIQKDRISFNGFVKAIKGQPHPQYKDYPTSRLADGKTTFQFRTPTEGGVEL